MRIKYSARSDTDTSATATGANRGPSTARPPSRTCRAGSRRSTAIDVGDPIVLALEDPALWEHPWIYFVEPGNLRLKDAEVPILREFLLRGGTATFDDFHGPYEWDNLVRELKRVFPDRDDRRDLQPPHPIFSCFYKLDEYPQMPGLGSFLNGRTWEKGGFVPHLRAILDDRERPMVLINWNTDMGDGGSGRTPRISRATSGTRPRRTGWASTKSIYVLTH